ncbi:MAG TPA: FAD-dependent oxidoreductase [Bacillota bacterium]|nr:FAD-dependent oxidoreductase [Bacillota bacterium]
MTDKIVVIGAGIAGFNAVKELRRIGYDKSITLIDESPDLPYDRPPMSKEYLRGEMSDEEILLEPASFYEENDIELLLGKAVVDIDIDGKKVVFDSGKKVSWDKLLITTGSKVRKLTNISGCDLNGIHYLKNIDDAQLLREQVKDFKKLVIVGGGFIGLEVAASCREMGIDVTVLEAAQTPLSRVLGPEMGEIIAGVHREKGVHLMTEQIVNEFQGTDKVEAVVTKNGDRYECDAVLVGIGVFTDMSLAGEHLKHNNNGYIINEYCETSVKDIYAAGDCAEWKYNNGDYIRVEHWDHAMNQGICAANNIVNNECMLFDTTPYFWSDQYDLSLQYFGHVKEWDETVLRGSVEDVQFTQFYLKDNKVEGALIINDGKAVLPTRKLIMQGTEVNADDLGNDDIPLKKLARKVRN